jgi:hypothetical protein
MRWSAFLSAFLLASLAGGVIPASGSESAPVTPAQGIAFVRAVNLQPSDLPGSARYQAEEGSPPEAAELQHIALRCGHSGRPRGRAVAAERSVLGLPAGRRLGEIVGSLVIVMPSEALAQSEIAKLATRKGRACLLHGLGEGTTGGSRHGAPVYSIRTAVVPVAESLGGEAVDVRFAARLQKGGGGLRRPRSSPPPKTVYASEAIFRVGPADIVLISDSLREALPAATEAHLLSVLHIRAEAQVL